MQLDAIAVGKNPPETVNVIIEVPIGGDPVKYEMDKASGAMVVDRFLYTAMHYPGNYGFIPHTLADDGDPLDVLVANHRPLMPGAVIGCRPVGVFFMRDESGEDEKIIAMPSPEITKLYDQVKSYKDLPEILLNQITHFFTHYKDLEEGKWTEIIRWGGSQEAHEIIMKSIETAKSG
ncbi:MAG: inorganic diphosphatase [Hyphomicrobiales bacterium]